MSLRTLIRLLSLSLALALVSPFVGNGVGFIFLLAGIALPGLTLAYLALPAGGGDLTRWQVRYQLNEGADLDRLEHLAHSISGLTFCPMGTGMCEPVTSGIKLFRSEFDARVGA